jgi:hypothetical protein
MISASNDARLFARSIASARLAGATTWAEMAAELHTTCLRAGARFLCALRDPATLVLGKGSIDVQH